MVAGLLIPVMGLADVKARLSWLGGIELIFGLPETADPQVVLRTGSPSEDWADWATA